MAKAALRNAATKANPVAISPRAPRPIPNPAAPTTANPKPTSWANLSGGTGSFSVTGARRGATNLAKIRPYGCLRGPPTAPTAKTTACTPRITAAAPRLTLDAINVTTRTAVVTHAANRGPRTSTWSTYCAVLVGDPIEVTFLLCWTSLEASGHIGPLRASTLESAIAQQLQQQQQPATRHRSTARRLVSITWRRADTRHSLPNDMVIKPTAGRAPTAGQRRSARRRRGSAGGRRRRTRTSSVRTTPKAAWPRPDWRPCRSPHAPPRAAHRRPGRPPSAPRRTARTTPR